MMLRACCDSCLSMCCMGKLRRAYMGIRFLSVPHKQARNLW